MENYKIIISSGKGYSEIVLDNKAGKFSIGSSKECDCVIRDVADFEAAGIPVISHAYYEFGLSVAERLHFIASSPACTMAHQTCEYEYLSDDILEGGKLAIEDGCFTLPESPGLGVRLDQEKLAYYNEYYVLWRILALRDQHLLYSLLCQLLHF